jgi:heme exporter protein D
VTGVGVIEGGWGFVWGAYGISAAILIGYAVSLHFRYRDELRRRGKLAGEDRKGG